MALACILSAAALAGCSEEDQHGEPSSPEAPQNLRACEPASSEDGTVCLIWDPSPSKIRNYRVYEILPDQEWMPATAVNASVKIPRVDPGVHTYVVTAYAGDKVVLDSEERLGYAANESVPSNPVVVSVTEWSDYERPPWPGLAYFEATVYPEVEAVESSEDGSEKFCKEHSFYYDSPDLRWRIWTDTATVHVVRHGGEDQNFTTKVDPVHLSFQEDSNYAWHSVKRSDLFCLYTTGTEPVTVYLTNLRLRPGELESD